MTALACPRQRIDRWLWFARLVKSRTRAAALVAAGHVRVNKARVTDPSHRLKIGDVLTIVLPNGIRVCQVAALGARRGPADEARRLFADLLAGKDEEAASGLMSMLKEEVE